MGIYAHIYGPCPTNEMRLGVTIKVDVQFEKKYLLYMNGLYIKRFHKLRSFFWSYLKKIDHELFHSLKKSKRFYIYAYKPQRSDLSSENITCLRCYNKFKCWFIFIIFRWRYVVCHLVLINLNDSKLLWVIMPKYWVFHQKLQHMCLRTYMR